MKRLTVADVISKLRKECVAAPVNYRKLVRLYKDSVGEMHQALTFLHQGLLENYHMVPKKEK